MENIFEKLAEITKPIALLESFKDKAIQAHNWLTHSPDKAGQRLINDYSEQLECDIKELENKGIDIEAIESYKKRYTNLFSSWLNAKSNCFSAFITGPANFPMRRHEKTQRSEQNHYELWQQWRIRAKKAIVRNSKPPVTFISEIEKYKSELSVLLINHSLMKEGNKRLKEAHKSGEDLTNYLIEKFNIAPHMISWTIKFGFRLTNNNANIKRIEQRIKELEQKEQLKNETPITEYTFEGGKLIVNYEVDRLQIIFDTKPNFEQLTAWKSKGLNSYNWSPSVMAWQRKITANAMWSVKRMLPQLTKI
jgi:hypothetical protein